MMLEHLQRCFDMAVDCNEQNGYEKMLRLELIEVTEADVKYRYYPEDSKEYGVVILGKTTRERDIEEKADGYDMSYAAHALRRLEEYCEKNTFPKEDIVAWG